MAELEEPAKRAPANIRSIQLTCVEVFESGLVEEVNTRISSQFGTPIKTTAGSIPSWEAAYEWVPAERTSFLTSIGNEPERLAFPPSAVPLEAAVDSVKLSGWSTSSLPFYTLTLRADLRPSYFTQADPEKLGNMLAQVALPLRLYVQTLGGLIGSLGVGTPKVPCITWVGATTSLSDIESLFSEILVSPVGTDKWRPFSPAIFDPLLPVRLPFRLEPQGVVELRSAIQSANVGLFFGTTAQVGLSGQLNPCVLMLVDSPELVKYNPLLPTWVSLPPTSVFEFAVKKSDSLVGTVALNGWLQAMVVEARRVEARASRWRAADPGLQGAASEPELDEILKIGIRTASLVLDLGLASRRFLDPLRGWVKGEFIGGKEVPAGRPAVLGHLGADTIGRLEDLRGILEGVRDEGGTLIQYASTRSDIESNKRMRALRAYPITEGQGSSTSPLWTTLL